jgi:WD40 repeat protein
VGFLVAPDLALTCAHVVSSALGTEAGVGTQVILDVPLVSVSRSADEDGTVWAVVEHWEPPAPDGGGDIAVLRLRETLPQGRPVTMVEAADVWGHPMRTFGFPTGREFGVWHAGRLLGRQAAGWIQAQLAEPSGYRIEQGFSGAPVWDDELGGVVGMVVAAESSTTPAGYLIPTETLLERWPELRALIRPASPYRGLAPFREADRAVFFGRGREVAELVELMGGPGPLAVVGPSGCGKSSLVFAGLLPALQERDGRRRTMVTFRPSAGRTVYTALAAVLLPVLEPELTEVERLSELATLAGVLQTQGLTDVVARLLERTGTSDLVVILDQGEELLAQHPDQVERFCEQLLGPNAPAGLRVLLTLRADFLDAALSSPALSRALRRSVYTLGAMTAEQLRVVVVEPVAGIPGVEFQEGLVERILADVGTDPGALPLLGLALTLLWERQSGGRLTHDAYEDLGRVPGSLGRYAEEVWSRSGLADDEDSARQLFLRLVQVSAGGEITRRVRTSDDLDAAQWELAQRLATTRLLVTGRDAEGRETVELAHEALVDGWARLRGWIDADREFLGWQEQFDRQLRQWESTKRDQGAFLRGVALAVAEKWLRNRPADLTMAGRQYVTLSRAHQRREVRRWRAVTAMLAVLVLAAGALAGLALDRGNRLNQQLDSAIAEVLSEEALARAPKDPATATQLALAAWRADPDAPQARTALGRQYLAMQSVDRAFTGLSDQPVNSFALSRDGSVMVLPHSQGFVVVTGLAGSEPHRWVVPDARSSTIPSVSPDGHWLAAVDRHGSVWVWDLRRRSGPHVLREGEPAQRDPSGARFSPDSRRLVWLAPAGPDGRRELIVWDVAGRTRIAEQLQWVSEPSITDVWLTDDPNLAIFSYNNEGRLFIRDLSSGTVVRTMPPDSAVVQHGRRVISCTNPPPRRFDVKAANATASVLRSDTGNEVLRFPLDSDTCVARLKLSGDGNYLVEDSLRSNKDYRMAKVADLSDGSTFDVAIPPKPEGDYSGLTFEIDLSMGVLRSGDGQVTVLLARGSTIFRMGHLTHDLRGPLKYHPTRLSDNGRYLVATGDDTPFFSGYDGFAVFDRHTGQELGHLTEAEIERGDRRYDQLSIDDSLWRLFKSSQNWILSQYSLPDLDRQAQYVLPAGVDVGSTGWAGAEIIDNRLVAIADGMLSVWDTRTRTRLSEPVRLGSTREEAEWYLLHGNFFSRPGHPHQIGIPAPDGSVELWNIEQRQLISTIPTRIDKDYIGKKLFFDNTGNRLAYGGANGTIEVWDIEARQAARAPIAAPDVSHLLGFDSANRLVTEDGVLDTYINFWDLATGRQSGSLPLATSLDYSAAVEDGRRIDVGGDFEVPYELPITAEQWFDHLCRALGRSFTEPERAILPPGTDLDPPCATNR